MKRARTVLEHGLSRPNRIRKMEKQAMHDWIALVRGRIKRNLDRNPNLTEDQRAAALEAEVGLAIAATNAGQPLNETNPPRDTPEDAKSELPPAVARDRERSFNWE